MKKDGVVLHSSSSSNKHQSNNTDKSMTSKNKSHEKGSSDAAGLLRGLKTDKHESTIGKLHARDHKDSSSDSSCKATTTTTSKMKAESAKEKSHHPLPTSLDISDKKKQHKIHQQLKKKKLPLTLSSAMKSVQKSPEKDRMKLSSSSHKEKEKGFKSFEKKSQDNETGKDSSFEKSSALLLNKSSQLNSSSMIKKKKSKNSDKNGKEGSREEKTEISSSLHCKTSSIKNKNSAFDSLVKNKGITSDQEMKSDVSDSELNFRRLENALKKDSDSSDDPSSSDKKGVKNMSQVSPGVISHTEWERAETTGRTFKKDKSPNKTTSHDKNHPTDSITKTPCTAVKKSKGLHRLQKEQERPVKEAKNLMSSPSSHSSLDSNKSSSVLSSSGQDNKKNKKQHKDSGLHSTLEDTVNKKHQHPLERLKDMKEGLPSLPSSKVFGHGMSSFSFNSDRKPSPPVVSSTSDGLSSLGRLKSPSSIRDDMSDSSDDLVQDLNEEARRSAEKAGHLGEDSESSCDELRISHSPCHDLMSSLGKGKTFLDQEKEQRPPRRFDQEADIETKRLEVELNQPWKKEPLGRPFEDLLCPNSKTGDEEHNVVSLHIPDTPSLSIHIPGLLDSPNKTGLPYVSPGLRHLPSALIRRSPNSSTKGLSSLEHHLPPSLTSSEQDSKVSLEGVRDEESGTGLESVVPAVDDQRIIEDDLAVSALLQEMDDKPPEIPLEASGVESGIEDIPVYDEHHISMIGDDEPPPLQISEEPSSRRTVSPVREMMLTRVSAYLDPLDLPSSSSEGSLLSNQQLPEELLLQTARNQTQLSIQQLHRSMQYQQQQQLQQQREQRERLIAGQIKERIERLSVSSSGSTSSSLRLHSPSNVLTFSPSKRLSTESQPDNNSALFFLDDKHSLDTNTCVGGRSAGDEQSERMPNFLQEMVPAKIEDTKSDRSAGLPSTTEGDLSSKDESEDTSRSSDRPKRGRRPKTRKASETGLPRHESSDRDQEKTLQGSVTPVVNRQTRARASVAVDPQQQSTPGSKIRRSPRVASTLESEGHNKDNESQEEESGDENESTEQRVRRGSGRGSRKKTASGDSKTSSESSALTSSESKTPSKERLTITVPKDCDIKDQSSHRKSLSPYDVFEFRDSDDDTPSLPLHEAMHPAKKDSDAPTKSPSEAAVTPPLTSSGGLLMTTVACDALMSQTDVEKKEDKEYTTELSHGKLSITIRLKDGQGVDTSVAEVVKTSKALIPPVSGASSLPVGDASKPSKQTAVTLPANVAASSTALNAEQEAAESKATRKSARLNSKSKCTIEQAIDDVLKGTEDKVRKNQKGKRSKSGDAIQDSHADSNDEEVTTDEVVESQQHRNSKTHRVTRSSTRGSVGSEIEDANAIFDETSSHSNTGSSSIPQRRHSHPTPVKTTAVQENCEDVVTTSCSVVELHTTPPTTTSASSSCPETPTVSLLESASLPTSLSTTTSTLSSNSRTETLSSSSTPSVISSYSSVIQEPVVRSTPLVIPSVSERIHNSTTAQKLKTGKGFILDSSQESFTSSLGKIPTQELQQTSPSSLDLSDNKHALAAKDRVQPPPAHTKITIEAKPSSVHFPSESSPVLQARRTPDVMQQSQTHVPHFATRAEYDPRIHGPLPSKEYLLQQEVLQRMQSQARPTPPPSSPHGQTTVQSLPPEVVQQHLRQYGSLPGLPSHSGMPQLHPSMPYDYATQLMLQQQYAMHPDLARGLPRLPYGMPPPSDTAKIMDDKNKTGRQKDDRIDDEQQRQQQQLLMPSPSVSGVPSHLRGLPSQGYPVGLIRPGIPPHLLSPHERAADSPGGLHAFHGKAGHDMMSSPAAGKGQQHSAQYIHPSIGSPAPGFLEGRPLQQPTHSPGSHVYRAKSPMNQREEDARKTGQMHVYGQPGSKDLSSPLSVNLAAPPGSFPLMGHPEEGLLRRAMPEGGSMALVPQPPQAHSVSQPPHHPQTPPHAAQAASGDSFLLQRYPVVWQGLLALKNDQAAVQMHFISGSPTLAQASLPKTMAEGVTASVKISQRMRLEQAQLEGVARKMQVRQSVIHLILQDYLFHVSLLYCLSSKNVFYRSVLTDTVLVSHGMSHAMYRW